MKPVKVGLLGLGTVGGGTFNVLRRNAQEIARRAGRGIEITMAAARDYDPAGLPGIEAITVSDDAFAVVDDPDIDLLRVVSGMKQAHYLRHLALQSTGSETSK